MTDVVTRHIQEHTVPGKRLGRHVEHDPRSRQYGVTNRFATADFRSVKHYRHTRPFDQGNLGSCTGNAAAGAIDTDPLFGVHIKSRLYERNAVALYSLATRLDEFPGEYPPEDTGSSGLGVAKAALQHKYIGSYHHAFSVEEAVLALMSVPVITGVNWYEGFDNPDADGMVAVAGQIRGGHEFEIRGFELAATANPLLDGVVRAVNSWGLNWGVKGEFFFTVRTWAQLLADEGDVTVLVA